MTLLGSSHKHDNAAAYETTGAGRHHNATGAGAGVGPGHTGFPAGAGMGVGGTVPLGSSAGMTQTYPGPGATSSLTGHTGPTNEFHAGGIPPAGAAHHGAGPTGHTSGGGGSSLTGKVESALGSMIGSASLKAKGLEKQREAKAVKMQSGELNEAERLEREAMRRRDRAVGHGAHPANSALGGAQMQHGEGPAMGAGAGPMNPGGF